MNKEQLREIFAYAKINNLDVALELTVQTRTATEIIIVKYDNLDYKLRYYEDNYNSKLELNRCADVKILNAKAIKFEI